jgi:hypothetical protein
VGLGVRYKLAQVELKWEFLHSSCNVRPGLDVPRHRVAVQQGLLLVPCSSAHPDRVPSDCPRNCQIHG